MFGRLGGVAACLLVGRAPGDDLRVVLGAQGHDLGELVAFVFRCGEVLGQSVFLGPGLPKVGQCRAKWAMSGVGGGFLGCEPGGVGRAEVGAVSVEDLDPLVACRLGVSATRWAVLWSRPRVIAT